MTVGIYKITNKVNGKCYIGQSVDIERRWRDHRNELNKTNPSNVRLYQAFRKYGFQTFSFEVLETCEEADLDALEIKYIAQYQSYQRGYNMTPGGDGTGKRMSEETRRKISEGQKGRRLSEEWKRNLSKALKGRKLSDEHKQKLSECKKGITFSEEHIRNLSISHMGHKPTPEANRKRSESVKRALASEEVRKKMSDARKGRKCPEETRLKISEKHKGKTLSKEHRQKLSKARTRVKGRKVSEETRRKIRESQLGPRGQREKNVLCDGVVYPTVKQCAEAIGVSAPTLSNWLHGRNKPKDYYKDLSFVNLKNDSQNEAS